MTQSVEVKEANSNFTLSFSRVEKISEDDPAIRFYGIKSQKYINGVLEEESTSGPITEDAAFADSLIATLSKNTVTPALLCEILDEILS